MKCIQSALLAGAAILAVEAPAQAQQPRTSVVERFDLNRDGKLDASEREAARDTLRRERPTSGSQETPMSRKQRLIDRFDSNKDGKLDAEEAAKARQVWAKLRARSDEQTKKNQRTGGAQPPALRGQQGANNLKRRAAAPRRSGGQGQARGGAGGQARRQPAQGNQRGRLGGAQGGFSRGGQSGFNRGRGGSSRGQAGSQGGYRRYGHSLQQNRGYGGRGASGARRGGSYGGRRRY